MLRRVFRWGKGGGLGGDVSAAEAKDGFWGVHGFVESGWDG